MRRSCLSAHLCSPTDLLVIFSPRSSAYDLRIDSPSFLLLRLSLSWPVFLLSSPPLPESLPLHSPSSADSLPLPCPMPRPGGRGVCASPGWNSGPRPRCRPQSRSTAFLLHKRGRGGPIREGGGRLNTIIIQKRQRQQQGVAGGGQRVCNQIVAEARGAGGRKRRCI